MDAAARYAREYLLRHPAVVVLRAPTGYLKTSVTRIAAQRARAATIVDCLTLASASDVTTALRAHAAPAGEHDAVEDFVAFENADAAVAKPDVLAAIWGVLSRRGARQTIAICTRRPFPLPPDVIATAIELTHEDLALDVAAELEDRGLPTDRIAEIRRLTLGWPMATYRLAAIAADSHPGVPLTERHGRAYDRLLQDVRLDFIDRLPIEERERLLADYHGDRDGMLAYAEPQSRRDLYFSKRARVDGVLLRDGASYRIPAIVVAALDAKATTTFPQVALEIAEAEPEIVFDVLSGEITVGGEVAHLSKREFEVFVNLAVKGRHVPYDVLLEEIWGDADDEPAKLKVTVGRLRKRLGFETIRSVDAGYVLGGNVSCTLTELEALAGAGSRPTPANLARLEMIRLRHRRGMMGAARHWPWYAVWSAKIEAFVERADVALGDHALEQGRFDVALERAHDAIALNAVSQIGHELALRALVAQGNIVAARQMLAAYEVTLRRTLGIELPESLKRVVCEVAASAS